LNEIGTLLSGLAGQGGGSNLIGGLTSGIPSAIANGIPTGAIPSDVANMIPSGLAGLAGGQ
jgi:hypothetical protein